MTDERPGIEATPTPIEWELPASEEELRAEAREVRETANSDAAIRAASVVGALGGNVPAGSGGLVGLGGALGVQQTQREEEREEAVDNRAEGEEADDDTLPTAPIWTDDQPTA